MGILGYRPRGKNQSLFAEAGLHRHPLATLGAPARQHRGSALGLHARTESVLLRALTPVGLESALGHEKSLLLIRSMAFRQTMSINDPGRTRQTGALRGSGYKIEVAHYPRRSSDHAISPPRRLPHRTLDEASSEIRSARFVAARSPKKILASNPVSCLTWPLTRVTCPRDLARRNCAQSNVSQPDGGRSAFSRRAELRAGRAVSAALPARTFLHHPRCSYNFAT
jgi:hypothetical protein